MLTKTDDNTWNNYLANVNNNYLDDYDKEELNLSLNSEEIDLEEKNNNENNSSEENSFNNLNLNFEYKIKKLNKSF